MILNTLIPLIFSTSSCPSISPMSNLNTTEYIRASWYIQEQQITTYQPENTLYCVTQTLNRTNRTVPLFTGPVIEVFNYANRHIVQISRFWPNEQNFFSIFI